MGVDSAGVTGAGQPHSRGDWFVEGLPEIKSRWDFGSATLKTHPEESVHPY